MPGPDDRFEAFLAAARGHPAVRAGAVYIGGAWALLQAVGLFGMGPCGLRTLALVLAAGFLLVTAALFIRERRASARPVGDDGTAVTRAGRKLPGGRKVVVTAAVLFALGSAAWWVRPRLLGAVAPGADTIAVLPFITTGPGVADYGEGMVDLLSASFNEVGAIRTISPRTVLHHWRQRAPGGTLDQEGALALGRELEAGSVLLGGITSLGARVRLSAELYGADSGDLLARAQVEDSPDSVLALVDRLAAELLREIWRAREPLPELRVSAITTESPAAMRAFLRGEQFYRRSQWDSAVAAFTRAVEEDSTFAFALFRLGESYGWARGHGTTDAVRYTVAAARFGDRLPERERSLVNAEVLHERADVAALDTMEAFVRRHPEDAMGWYALGDIRYHADRLLAFSEEQVIGPFERVVDLDPSLASALLHPLDYAADAGDSARYHALLSRLEAAGPTPTGRAYIAQGRIRWSRPDSALAVFARELREIGFANGIQTNRVISAMGKRGLTDPAVPPELFLQVVDTVFAIAPGSPDDVALDRAASAAVVLVSTGRIEAARPHLEALEASPRAVESYTIRGNAAMLGLAPPEFASEAIRAAGETPAAAFGLKGHHLAQGDLAAARAVELPPTGGDTTAAGRLFAALAESLAGWEQVVAGDTAGGLERLEQGLRDAGYSGRALNATRAIRFHHAIILASRPETRERGVRALRLFVTENPLYTVAAYSALAEALEAAGDRAGAAEAYGHVVRLLSGADPYLQPRVDAARRALERLGLEGAG